MFPCVQTASARWNGQLKSVFKNLQWKDRCPASRPISWNDFVPPEPFFKIKQCEDQIKLAMFKGHEINGNKLMKEVTLHKRVYWEFELRGKLIDSKLLSLENVEAKNLDMVKLILETVKKVPVCEGVIFNREAAASNVGSIEQWKCDDQVYIEGRQIKQTVRCKTCPGVQGFFASSPACKPCHQALRHAEASCVDETTPESKPADFDSVFRTLFPDAPAQMCSLLKSQHDNLQRHILDQRGRRWSDEVKQICLLNFVHS